MFESSAFSEEKKDDGDTSQIVKAVMNGNEDPTGSSTDFRDVSVAAQQQDPTPKKDPAPTHPLWVASKNNERQSPPFLFRFLGGLLRILVIDFPLTVLFAAVVGAAIVHKTHDKYFSKQIELMIFQDRNRPFKELTYYHRDCRLHEEVSATSREELIVPYNATADECVAHQMRHGASLFRDLLTPQTMHELREFIVAENTKQDGFHVIENEHRYSWGLDINMHPALKKYWKELASHDLFLRGLQAIVGPDPAIIEFTAITSAYGAKDQFDHQDVGAPGNGVKYAHCKSSSLCFSSESGAVHDMVY